MSLRDIASKFLVAFNYDPGHSDLDDEQSIHISVTLGDWRKLNQEMPAYMGCNAQGESYDEEKAREQWLHWWAVNHPHGWWASEFKGEPVNTAIRILVWDIAHRAYQAGRIAAVVPSQEGK